MITLTITYSRRNTCTLGNQVNVRICLHISYHNAFNALFRQRAEVSLLRPHITDKGSHGILTVSAIALAIRLKLRTRLTPG